MDGLAKYIRNIHLQLTIKGVIKCSLGGVWDRVSSKTLRVAIGIEERF